MVSALLPGAGRVVVDRAGPHSRTGDRMGDDVLTGWQQISEYLRVSQKTAQRYKNLKGLPVTYNGAGRVEATRQALDGWRFNEGENSLSEHCPKDFLFYSC
jgi:hypothetical protein